MITAASTTTNPSNASSLVTSAVVAQAPTDSAEPNSTKPTHVQTVVPTGTGSTPEPRARSHTPSLISDVCNCCCFLLDCCTKQVGTVSIDGDTATITKQSCISRLCHWGYGTQTKIGGDGIETRTEGALGSTEVGIGSDGITADANIGPNTGDIEDPTCIGGCISNIGESCTDGICCIVDGCGDTLSGIGNCLSGGIGCCLSGIGDCLSGLGDCLLILGDC